MNSRSKKANHVVPLPLRQLPFETWRPIFQAVFAAKNSISHPPSDFVISALDSRLNVYRCLAQVSRAWRDNARDVFFEEIEALTADTLKGLVKTFQHDRSLALVVSRISFSFGEFRCSASMPRRPRLLQPLQELNDSGPEPSSPTSRTTPDWKTIHRRDLSRYQPSVISQASHWMRWQADVGQILAMCSSLSDVKIIFTNHFSSTPMQRTNNYRSWFAPPDLTNEGILNGLLHSPNLRSLHLVDPTPLEKYGPALVSWKRLQYLTIILTRPFQELQETAFIPPTSLRSFRFHDRSGRIPWPLASDLARCSNLQALDLGVRSLVAASTTAQAIGFLCKAYQHSLRDLTLSIPGGAQMSGYQDILESVAPLHFPHLRRLRLLNNACDTSIFSYFEAEALDYVEIGWLMIEPCSGSREDKWSRGLSHTSLRGLERLTINQDDPDHLRKDALYAVCHRLGIILTMGCPPREERDEESHVLSEEIGNTQV